jgi:hypothetical protein
MLDTSRQPVSTTALAGRSWLVPCCFALLGIIAIGEGSVIWYDRATSSQDYQQQVVGARSEQEHTHARSVAAAFLRAVVEDDFSATRPLLAQVSKHPPGAAEARGREAALRDMVHAWFTQRKLDRRRLKGYGSAAIFRART